MPKTPKRGPGRPPKPMPERIPDTPDNVARAVLNTPPKSKGAWDYLKKEPKGKLGCVQRLEDALHCCSLHLLSCSSMP